VFPRQAGDFGDLARALYPEEKLTSFSRSYRLSLTLILERLLYKRAYGRLSFNLSSFSFFTVTFFHSFLAD
jgi:hypothetical protein